MSSRHISWSARVPIGEANGVKVYASTDFLRYYEEGRDRMGGDTALTNIELATAASTAQTTANTAVAAAATAQTTANTAVTNAATAQATANTANSTANTANTTANALKAPTYVTLSASADLTNERVLTAGAGVKFTDAGAGGALTVAIDSNVSLKDSLAATIVEVDDGALGLFGATPVAQSTGWGTPTGTATKTTFDTATVTLPQLAERVKALIDYFKLRGDIGA